jgi:heme/copper-type cytochrome/quinol oxidase subunit 2
MVPIFMYASTVDRGQADTSCNILWPESEHISGQTAFTLYSFILGFAIPLLLIFVFYFLVIRKLKTVGPKNKSKEKKKSHRKVTKLVLTVIAVYVLCWLPYWITQVSETIVKVKQSRYTPWRRLGREEVWLLLILDFGTRWG